MSTAWHVSFLRFLKADFFVKINIYIALRARVVLNILAPTERKNVQLMAINV